MKVDSAWLRRFAYLGARYGPRHFVAYSPRIIGLIFFLALGSVRRRVRRNLRHALGPRQRAAECYDTGRTFMNYAACLAEGLGTERREAEEARFGVEGAPYLEQALGTGRGLILLTAHIGPFEAAARFFTRDFNAKLMLVMGREADEKARRFHDAIRQRMGVLVTHVGEHALDALPLLSHLQDGGVAAVQLDRMPEEGRGLSVEFFGNPWRVPAGPFRVAALCQVPLMTVFARRRGFYDYEFVLGEPQRLKSDAEGPELQAAAQRLVAEMERAILRDPTQWFHFEAPRHG